MGCGTRGRLAEPGGRPPAGCPGCRKRDPGAQQRGRVSALTVWLSGLRNHSEAFQFGKVRDTAPGRGQRHVRLGRARGQRACPTSAPQRPQAVQEQQRLRRLQAPGSIQLLALARRSRRSSRATGGPGGETEHRPGGPLRETHPEHSGHFHTELPPEEMGVSLGPTPSEGQDKHVTRNTSQRHGPKNQLSKRQQPRMEWPAGLSAKGQARTRGEGPLGRQRPGPQGAPGQAAVQGLLRELQEDPISGRDEGPLGSAQRDCRWTQAWRRHPHKPLRYEKRQGSDGQPGTRACQIGPEGGAQDRPRGTGCCPRAWAGAGRLQRRPVQHGGRRSRYGEGHGLLAQQPREQADQGTGQTPRPTLSGPPAEQNKGEDR